MERKDKMLMKKILHKKRKLAWSLFLVLVFTSLLPYFASHNFVTSKKSEEKNEGAVKAMAVDPDAFLVLEVVPDQGYGSFGYLVGGQEPIDLTKLAADGKAGDFLNAFGTNHLYRLVTEYSNQEKPGEGYVKITGGNSTVTYSSGYYKMVPEGEGDFYLTNENVFEPEVGFGTYKWVEAENTNKVPLNQFDEIVVWRENETLPKFTYKKDILVSKEYFKTISLDSPTAKVAVKTVTPATITDEDIKNADLITFSNGQSMQKKIVDLWNDYGGTTNKSSTGKSFASVTDLSWSHTIQIFQRVLGMGDEALPIVLDATMYDSNLNKNIKKLYFMIKKMNPLVFHNFYLNDNTNGGGEKIDTLIDGQGRFKSGSSWYSTWKEEWFKQPSSLLSLYGIVDETHNTSLNAGGTSNNCVMSNVYTFNGHNAIPQVFNSLEGSSSVTNNKYSGEFFQYMSENPSKFEVKNNSTSPAYALKYIIGYNPGANVNDKSVIRILDLEPSNLFTKTIVDFRKIVPTFTGSIFIEKQTTATFNGKIEDLNKEYDMIYMGLDFNNTTFTLGNNVPKYNDTSLNGKIYLHVGDRVMGSTNSTNINEFPVNWLKGTIASPGETRLPGNDITQLKKKNLEDFLKAGYPIVAANDLYDRNATKVDAFSYISKFIGDNKGTNGNLLKENQVNTQDSKMITKYLAIVKPTLEIISEPLAYNPSSATQVQNNDTSMYINGNDIDNRNFVFEFRIKENSVSSHEKYTAKFYVDRNADGKYGENERIRTVENISVGYTRLTIKLDEKFLGAIPWKLEIVNSDHSSIRTERIGLSAIRRSGSEKKDIFVLQVNSDSGNLNLSTDTRFKKYMNNLNDFNIHVKTITCSKLEEKYEGAPFDKTSQATREATDKLKEYNMIIFGFDDMYTTISNNHGAIDNIKYYIDQGKSVLFTHDVTSFNNTEYLNNQFGFTFNKYYRGYLSMDRFGARIGNGDVSATEARDKPYKPNGGLYQAIHGYTAWALKRIGSFKSSSNTVPIYPGIPFASSNLETTKVSKINTGQLTNYPYKIDSTFQIAKTHPQYFQLDLEDENVVVWYCLADDGNSSGYYAKSPNDASNNYYIYNKGNVTYSGVGHSTINQDMEAQLFVNTMIAAYKAASEPPSAEVTNIDAIKSKNEYYLYVNNDYKNGDFPANEFLDVNFIPYENSLLSENMTGTIRFEDLPTDWSKFSPQVKAACENIPIYPKEKTTSVEGGKVRSGFEYTIRYPLALLNSKSSRKIVISLENEKGTVGETNVYLLRRSLFDLD